MQLMNFLLSAFERMNIIFYLHKNRPEMIMASVCVCESADTLHSTTWWCGSREICVAKFKVCSINRTVNYAHDKMFM